MIKHIEDVYMEDNFDNLNHLVELAVKRCKNDGATTYTSAQLAYSDSTNNIKMRSCNYGDSGFMVLRPSPASGDLTEMERSKSQQHYFNCPFQVGTHSKFPLKADTIDYTVEENDIIVMATDGIWDNLFAEDIKACIKP